MAGGHQQAGGEFHVSLRAVFRDSLRHVRQAHLYSGTAGRTVWAQSRQTNRPPFIGDHQSELDASHAIRAADGQGCVGQSWHRALLHMSKGGWHAGFQTLHRVIPLKTKGSSGTTRVANGRLRRDFGKLADRPAGIAETGHWSCGFPRYASSSVSWARMCR